MNIASLLVSVVSVVIAGLAYRRAGQSVRSKLRLDLRNADNELRTLVASLPNALTEAKVERESATAMMGSADSGAAKRQRDDHEDRQRELSELQRLLPSDGEEYAGWAEKALESALVERNATVMRAKRLAALCVGVKDGARMEIDRNLELSRVYREMRPG